MVRGSSVSRGIRLTRIQHYLHKNPQGLTTGELAQLCGAGIRTIQRDLLLLQSDLHVPLVDKPHRRYGIYKDYVLSPVHFSLYEALVLFLAARLIIRQTDEGNPHLQSAIDRLASLLPHSMDRLLKQSLQSVINKKVNQQEINIFEQAALAWGTGRRVKITYHSFRSGDEQEWIVNPYFIEMTGVGFSTYLIGYAESDKRKGINTFKFSRIKNIELLDEFFEMPGEFDMGALLNSSWGVIWGEDIAIELKFSAAVTRRVKETIWHASQELTDLPDGGCLLRLRVGSLMEITPWIRSWGADVEVLEPRELRDKFCSWTRQLHGIYCSVER